MSMIDYVITGVFGVAILGITILLLTGRGANLIAGFNTLSSTQKEQYDKVALCKFTGKILIPIEIAIFSCVIGGILEVPGIGVAAIIVSITSFVYIIAVAVYANTGNRFKKQSISK